MSRLIDADAFLKDILTDGIGKTIIEYSESDIGYMIRKRPTVDAVPVIRCKDCKFRYWDDWLEEYFCQCHAEYMQVLPDDFCSYAERKEKKNAKCTLLCK